MLAQIFRFARFNERTENTRVVALLSFMGGGHSMDGSMQNVANITQNACDPVLKPADQVPFVHMFMDRGRLVPPLSLLPHNGDLLCIAPLM
jgi:hypothetical protein